MKNQMMKLFLMAGSLGAFALGAQAQTTRLTADIPFDFHVQGRAVEAGHYVFTSGQDQITPNRIVTASGKHVAFYLSNPSSTKPGKARLIFRCYSNDCYLGSVVNTNGNEKNLAVSKEERAARERLSASIKPESTVVYASLF
jgi:hypothetical protein